jgi:hypothetical protein
VGPDRLENLVAGELGEQPGRSMDVCKAVVEVRAVCVGIDEGVGEIWELQALLSRMDEKSGNGKGAVAKRLSVPRDCLLDSAQGPAEHGSEVVLVYIRKTRGAPEI